MRSPDRPRIVPVVIGLAVLASTAYAASEQTDWSGGDGEPGPVIAFEDRFDTGDLAWRSVAGQLALPSAPRGSFPLSVIATDSDRPTRIAVADLDGDGDLDLAGCAELVGGPYEADAFVVWFENLDGQGESFAPAMSIWMGSSSWSRRTRMPTARDFSSRTTRSPIPCPRGRFRAPSSTVASRPHGGTSPGTGAFPPGPYSRCSYARRTMPGISVRTSRFLRAEPRSRRSSIPPRSTSSTGSTWRPRTPMHRRCSVRSISTAR